MHNKWARRSIGDVFVSMCVLKEYWSGGREKGVMGTPLSKCLSHRFNKNAPRRLLIFICEALSHTNSLKGLQRPPKCPWEGPQKSDPSFQRWLGVQYKKQTLGFGFQWLLEISGGCVDFTGSFMKGLVMADHHFNNMERSIRCILSIPDGIFSMQ